MSAPNKGKRVMVVVALGLAFAVIGAFVYSQSVFDNVQTLPLFPGRPGVLRHYGTTARSAVVLWLILAAVWVEAWYLFLWKPGRQHP